MVFCAARYDRSIETLVPAIFSSRFLKPGSSIDNDLQMTLFSVTSCLYVVRKSFFSTIKRWGVVLQDRWDRVKDAGDEQTTRRRHTEADDDADGGFGVCVCACACLLS